MIIQTTAMNLLSLVSLLIFRAKLIRNCLVPRSSVANDRVFADFGFTFSPVDDYKY